MKLSHHAIIAASTYLLTCTCALATTVTATTAPAGMETWSYVAPPSTGPQTHILSVYSSGNLPLGSNKVLVHVNGATSKPVTLVVSAYEPTTWVFDGPGRNNIGTVIINGFNKSKVLGLPFFTKVVHRAGINAHTGQAYFFSACAVEWPSDTRGCDTPGLVSGVENYTKAPITSFTADDYDITDFTVNLTK